MIKAIFFLLLTFTLHVKSNSNVNCTYSNNNYFIILGDYTATNTGELNNIDLKINQNVWFLDESNKWVHSNQTLPGSPGIKASVWYYFANYLNKQNNQDIYIANLARDDARLNDWSAINNSKTYWNLFNNTINLLPQNTIINVLWMQGENDAKDLSFKLPRHYSNENHYSDKLIDLINWSPECYQWGISLTSYSPYNTISAQNHIRYQQSRVVNKLSNITANKNRIWGGPDTDQFCNDDRYKNIYFNIHGMDLVANSWITSLKNKQSLNPNQEYCNYYIIDISLLMWFVIRFIIIVALICFLATICLSCSQINYHSRFNSLPNYSLPRYSHPTYYSSNYSSNYSTDNNRNNNNININTEKQPLI